MQPVHVYSLVLGKGAAEEGEEEEGVRKMLGKGGAEEGEEKSVGGETR